MWESLLAAQNTKMHPTCRALSIHKKRWRGACSHLMPNECVFFGCICSLCPRGGRSDAVTRCHTAPTQGKNGSKGANSEGTRLTSRYEQEQGLSTRWRALHACKLQLAMHQIVDQHSCPCLSLWLAAHAYALLLMHVPLLACLVCSKRSLNPTA